MSEDRVFHAVFFFFPLEDISNRIKDILQSFRMSTSLTEGELNRYVECLHQVLLSRNYDSSWSLSFEILLAKYDFGNAQKVLEYRLHIFPRSYPYGCAMSNWRC